jgi:hypothetical protein
MVVTGSVPREHAPDDREGQIGDDLAVMLHDLIQQPRNLAAADIFNEGIAKLREDQPVQRPPLEGGRSKLFPLEPKIALHDGSELVILGGFGFAPLGDRIAALGYVAEDAQSLLTSVLEGQKTPSDSGAETYGPPDIGRPMT